ncbi:MAG: hypothetical protein OQK82_03235, partial [Candidatus Pacearchaeota archaeon]|nr:hypothetical protein [Candidatus Pacearchaeota archaeon]
MKKRVLLFVLISLFLISFILAADDTTKTSVEDKAYTCLEDRFEQTSCESLSDEARIFALLTLGECADEIIDDSSYESDIKYTAQAILALDKAGIDASDTINWLWEQNQTPEDLIWYLQIDSSEETICTITYDNDDYEIGISEDKKIDSNAGSCLSRATGNYWLQINNNCFDEEFEISCNEDFLTNLLFREPTSNTIHVSSESTSSSADGTTLEQINIMCFENGGDCDYLGTLWGALVLDFIGEGESVEPLTFYLSALSEVEDYEKYMPESFLYYLTGEDDFEDQLIEKQSTSGFWRVGVNKYYDTAVAMLSVPSASTAWQDTVEWLAEDQADSGCWNSNNFLDTAFLAYTIWPRGISSSGTSSTGEGCTDAGYFCMSGINCNGYILDGYDCDGVQKCCSEDAKVETCSEIGGNICSSNQECSDGTTESTFDLSSGETCCIEGSCVAKSTQEYTCESSGGTCRIDGCSDDEQVSYESCEFGDTCCVEKEKQKASLLWLWVLILLLLIGLVILAIWKKDKTRELWLRIKSKFQKITSNLT